MKKRVCEKCVYFQENEHTPAAAFGECRYSSPAYDPDNVACFPQTRPTDWCGDFVDYWPEHGAIIELRQAEPLGVTGFSPEHDTIDPDRIGEYDEKQRAK